MKKIILIIVPVIIILGIYLYPKGLDMHKEGAERFLKQMNFTDVSYLDTHTWSKSLSFVVTDKDNETDTVYVSVSSGNYQIRYYKNFVGEFK